MFALNKQIRYSKIFTQSFCVFSLACYLNYAPIMAQTSQSQLEKLENKLFHHTYPKENTEARLSRLEKLIFGGDQKGGEDDRIQALIKAVPNLESASTKTGQENSSESALEDAEAKADKARQKRKSITHDDETSDNSGVGNYPAVTAMETKLFGKDYSRAPIKERLSRLEKKVLGTVSDSDDLSERVDKLKSATGIDVARKPGSASDWIEDDEDSTAFTPSTRGAADLDFGRRDIYQDLQKSYGGSTMPSYTPPANPFASPYFPEGPQAKQTPVSIKSFGLSQQVTALEHEILAKSYERDPLPARVNRIEAAVFPGQKPSVDKPLPERVNILLSKIPIRQDELQHLAKIYQIEPEKTKARKDDLDDLNDPAAIQKSRGNLSRIIGGLGSMLSGGMAGGYAMPSGTYVIDPASGLLVDPGTGYVVNPNSGTMYGTRRAMPYPYGTGAYGMGNYGYNNYNNYYNRMAPFGSPGMMPGMGSGFSIGGGGMGFGF